MANIVETVAGILLALPDNISRHERSIPEQSLLHAWFNAKQTGAPVSMDRLSTTLGRIGWNLTDIGTTQAEVPLECGGVALPWLGLSSRGNAALANILGANASLACPLVSAWRREGTAASSREMFIAELRGTSWLTICAFKLDWPDHCAILSGRVDKIGISATTESYSLDRVRFDSVAAEVLAKVSHRLDRIVRAPAVRAPGKVMEIN
ncbi:hypothetical protein [Qingshengfaniella alkalisoli]|uniref:Uncharacterized protein n=1 Tax=Qingshengfaniella alkalisoli TaxID=2599296 RepID=A0A5B8J0Y1_9RHOB|nr:hypothetical protein [Qingshengfaniella alkalisoli]QDY70841.1 hypothetical protein FPZ52_14120 [Qingshengfaniella alkalisoli]